MTGPNVVCIVVDDLGWRDLGCYGSPFYETPHIDRLAATGERFTDAYAAAPVCSPTRASVLSGQYPARVGVTDWIDSDGSTHPARGQLIDAPYEMHLPGDVPTLADAFDAADYRTWHVGKWHLGGDGHHPEDHGFDENVGGCSWGRPMNGFFVPWDVPGLENAADGTYLTDHLTDRAIELVTDDGDDPFFLHMAYYAVHTPIEAPEHLVEKYETKRRRLGLDEVTEVETGGRFPCTHKRDDRIERRRIQSDPEYAAMVERLDWNVGRLLTALDDAGVADDTVVVFTSDNGGLATAEGSPTCNRPLGEGKGWMYEGGNRVPLIVRWPGETRANAVRTEPVTSPDLYPTLLDCAGQDVPRGHTVDSISLVPLFGASEDTVLERDAIFWHYPHYGNQGGTPSGAVRRGKWKLVEFFEGEQVRLFDLEGDIRESTDLSGERPDVVADLRASLREWRDDVGATMPASNPDFTGWPERETPDDAR